MLTACLLQATTAWTQTAESSPLQVRVEQICREHHGKVALYAENLRTHQQVSVDADKPVQTASVIKLTILFTAMEQVRAGTLRLSTPVVMRKADQVGGSGVLQQLDTPLTLTVRDALQLMVTESDNTATNLMIDTVGLHAVDDEIGKLGLKNTWLYKKVFTPATESMPADQKLYGLGKTTPREMASLLGRMYRCEFAGKRAAGVETPGDSELCGTMLHMLQQQGSRQGLPRLLEAKDSAAADAAMGNKTGSLDAVRNDVGLVSTKAGMVVLAIFTYDNEDQGWSVDNEAELTIAKLSELIVRTWSPEGLDAKGYAVQQGNGEKR